MTETKETPDPNLQGSKSQSSERVELNVSKTLNLRGCIGLFADIDSDSTI